MKDFDEFLDHLTRKYPNGELVQSQMRIYDLPQDELSSAMYIDCLRQSVEITMSVLREYHSWSCEQ